MLPSRRTMVKMLRIFAGVLLIGLIFRTATLATRDCTIGLYVYDDCLWVWIREQLGLPASKFLRAGVLELIGLALLAGLYLTVRFVFPPWRRGASTLDTPPHDRPHEPSSQRTR